MGFSKMENYSRNLLAVALCSLLSACATTGDSNLNIGGVGIPIGSKDAVESKPNATDTSKKGEYMAQGCIGGGLLGAVLGYALGESDKDAAKGFVAGCVAGVVAGFTVAERTEQYASANQAIDSEIKRNQENSSNLRKYNQSLQENIAQYESQINQIRQQKMVAEEENKQLQAVKGTVSEQTAKAEQALKIVNDELMVAKLQRDKYGKDATPENTKNWDQEITGLEKERDDLDTYAKKLAEMNASIQ